MLTGPCPHWAVNFLTASTEFYAAAQCSQSTVPPKLFEDMKEYLPTTEKNRQEGEEFLSSLGRKLQIKSETKKNKK